MLAIRTRLADPRRRRTAIIGYFILSIVLAIAEIFSVGLVVVALAPNQTAASAMGGVLFFVLLFLSGLWVQPVQAGVPLRDIM